MLLGRATETARLDGLIRDAGEGRGGALVVEGAPGIGKTALIEDAAQRAAQLSVLRIAGVESELVLPYAALQQLCGRMIERLAFQIEPIGFKAQFGKAESQIMGKGAEHIPQ